MEGVNGWLNLGYLREGWRVELDARGGRYMKRGKRA